MESFNEQIKKEIWLSELYERDKLAFQIEYFLIGGASLKNELTCMLNERCKFGINVGKGEDVKHKNDKGELTVGPVSYSWVFCYACNRIYHLACQGHRTDAFKQIQLVEPYCCNECVEYPLNDSAKDFYSKRNEIDQSMQKRREYFTKVFVDLSKTDNNADQETDDDVQSVNSNDRINDDMRKIMEKCEKNEKENNDLKVELTKCYEKLKEYVGLQSEVLQLRKQLFEAKHDNCQPSTFKESQRLRFSTSTVFSPTHANDSCDNLMRDPIPSDRIVSSSRSEAKVPVPKRKSILDEINLNDLSLSERITLEATEAQREMAFTQNLTSIRRALPKITKFDGDPKKWIQFKRDVDRYKTIGKYDDYEMRIFVLQALEGIALTRVEGAIDKVPCDETLKSLQKCFGEPMRIIDKCAKDILSIKVPKELFRDDVLKITSKIQEYRAACKYAEVELQNSNHLGMHIFDQLSLLHKILFRHSYRDDHEGTECRVIDLDVVYTFLENLSDDLEAKRIDEKKFEEKKYDDKKPKGFQMNVASFKERSEHHDNFKSSNNLNIGFRNSDDYMYELKDMNTSHLGYDLKELGLISKYCECCMKDGHYTIQCYKYKSMNISEKLNFVNEKKLCRNCVVTNSHKAVECLLKGLCGFRDRTDRCRLKHHITLHRALTDNSNKNFKFNNRNWSGGNGGSKFSRAPQSYRRNNSNFNQKKAEDIANQNQNYNRNPAGKNTSEASLNELINQAPTISSMPNSQVAFFNSRSKANVNSASGSNNTANNSSSNPIVVSVEALCSEQSLRTVKVFKNIFLSPKGFVVHYSLGDSAAEVTLIKDEMREILGIEGESCELVLQWTDGSTKTVEAKKINITVKGMADYCEEIELKNCYAVTDLYLPRRSLDINHLKRKYPYLKDVDYESYERIAPSMLLGSPHASVFESSDTLIDGGVGKPVGMRTKLGWTVYGGCPDECCNYPYNVASMNISSSKNVNDEDRITNEQLSEMYAYFCSIESLGIANVTSYNTEEEQRALNILSKGMKTLDSGFIEVPLAWNCKTNDIPKLPNNFAMVYKRQVAHERVLSRNPLHFKAFNDNFKELLLERYVRPACELDLNSDWSNISYIPMSLVKNANKDPPKFRNVFDASARFHGVSLNDHLLKGPDLLVNLIKPLLRMRENEIAFTADIKSMYMRVKINMRDQQVQRVLWRPSPDEEFRVFVFSSMLFGPKSSPFTSQFVKNATADKWHDKYPYAAESIKNYMYMDDLLTSESSLDKAISVAKQCIEIFDSINWKLITFQSNSVELLKALPVTNISQDTIPLLESENDSCVTKVLGCVWDTKNDAYVFTFDKNLFIKIVKDCQHRPTKRDQCSTIARIFDVLGLISHFIIRGKMLVQRSFMAELDWDDEIGEKEHKAWIEWLNEVENVAKLKIQRRYNLLRNLNECEEIELHTFADAGGEAFAAVSYIVTKVNNKRYSNIVMAKAKVTPIHHKARIQISEIPRLELCACAIAARLANTIVTSYPHINFKKFFWTDSEVVLRWIVKPNHRLLKYATSPIIEILQSSLRTEWRYVPSKLNVADIATKFQKVDFSDSQSVWFTGPQFLLEEEDQWPKTPSFVEPPVVIEPLMINVINLDRNYAMSTQKLPSLSCTLISDWIVDDFRASIKSDWDKLVRATARALKIMMYGMIPLVRSKQFNDCKKRIEIRDLNKNFTLMGMSDRERAKHFIVRKAQRESFITEYECLRSNREFNNVEMKQLNVFLDEECLIRIDSRVELSYELYPQRFAPLMPRKHWITKLYLKSVHERYKHIHLEAQIAFARSEFWIPQVRVELQSIRDNCNSCSLSKAQPYVPKMAPLPECRTNPLSRPFETTGLDCMGPFVILNYNRPKKVWVLIFACALTRFIHLRILQSLESIKVLEAIVEFVTMHGPVRTFISDRGTNFVGASNVLEEDKKIMMKLLAEQHEVLTPQLIDRYNVEWKLLPAHSPWMGGLYERLIKEVKRSVAHVMNDRKLSITAFNIALHDAAHRINNRPLTHNAVSADDAPILTPHLLAKGRCGWPYLPGLQSSLVTDGSCDRLLYRRGRAVADEIMRKFYTLYLPVLTKRVKWFKDQKPIKKGDLVLLIEPNETRKEWKRAKVVKIYKGRDGRTRVADVELPDKKVKKYRSIQRLAKIEIKSDE